MTPEPVDRTPTILVADDQPDIVMLVARRLVRAGFEVITAADGAEALQLAQEQLPDLLVLDVMMPKLTGIQVSRLLRAASATCHIPVILCSAGLPDKLVVPIDADAFVKKPFGSDEIQRVVFEVLARPRRVA